MAFASFACPPSTRTAHWFVYTFLGCPESGECKESEKIINGKKIEFYRLTSGGLTIYKQRWKAVKHWADKNQKKKLECPPVAWPPPAGPPFPACQIWGGSDPTVRWKDFGIGRDCRRGNAKFGTEWNGIKIGGKVGGEIPAKVKAKRRNSPVLWKLRIKIKMKS